MQIGNEDVFVATRRGSYSDIDSVFTTSEEAEKEAARWNKRVPDWRRENPGHLFKEKEVLTLKQALREINDANETQVQALTNRAYS